MQIAITEGNNELNVQMETVIQEAFTFGMPNITRHYYTSSYSYPVIACNISNERNNQITRTISVWHRAESGEVERLNFYDGVPFAQAPGTPTIITGNPSPYTLTLTPGGIVTYNFTNILMVGAYGAQAYFAYFNNYVQTFWIQDELGNKSAEVIL
jgi:hypothetical protein